MPRSTRIAVVQMNATPAPAAERLAQAEVFVGQCSQAGRLLQAVPSGTEGFTLAEVSLPDVPPPPAGKQPPFGIPRYLYAMDALAEMLFAAEYKQKAPRERSNQVA